MVIEENDEILTSFCGEDGIVYALCEFQEERDSSDINNTLNLIDGKKVCGFIFLIISLALRSFGTL